jgi:hypothetical protein
LRSRTRRQYVSLVKDTTALASRQAIYLRLAQAAGEQAPKSKARWVIDTLLEPLVGESDEKKAAFLGVRYLTIWRHRSIKGYKASEEFIAAVLAAPWPEVNETGEPIERPTFDDLFVIRSGGRP